MTEEIFVCVFKSLKYLVCFYRPHWCSQIFAFIFWVDWKIFFPSPLKLAVVIWIALANDIKVEMVWFPSCIMHLAAGATVSREIKQYSSKPLRCVGSLSLQNKECIWLLKIVSGGSLPWPVQGPKLTPEILIFHQISSWIHLLKRNILLWGRYCSGSEIINDEMLINYVSLNELLNLCKLISWFVEQQASFPDVQQPVRQ